MKDITEETKTPKEREEEYLSEVKRTVRKKQLISFVHFYYQNLEDFTFNEIVNKFNKEPYEQTNI